MEEPEQSKDWLERAMGRVREFINPIVLWYRGAIHWITSRRGLRADPIYSLGVVHQ